MDGPSNDSRYELVEHENQLCETNHIVWCIQQWRVEKSVQLVKHNYYWKKVQEQKRSKKYSDSRSKFFEAYQFFKLNDEER